MKIDYPASEVTQIVASVFETMMGLEVQPDETAPDPLPDPVTALVHLTGERTGALLLGCDHAQACRWTGRFLGMAPPAALDADVRDVLSELANMIGGNLKGAIAPGAQLSMPSVIDGSNYHLQLSGAAQPPWQWFVCADGRFRTVWMERDVPG
ncbi:MAG: chemotaxis protein CheX [Bryobacteraceae bacterium]|nr:chemotaxis protein CheX [Solibacteraceae bacterium]MCO5351908.1 chemotaxis protein CheX [Bryobacteraceae bacterium]